MTAAVRSVLVALALLAATLVECAVAQRPQAAPDEVASGTTFLNPFPESDIYRLAVIGDSFAEGLLGGLTEAFGGEPRLAISKKVRPIGTLVRPEWEDDVKAEEINRELAHIAVVMFGLSDRQIIRVPNAKPLSIGSDEWQDEYGRRVDRWLKALKKKNIAVYFVGYPALREPRAQGYAETINELMREKAQANGARFIDIMEAFQDENGNFSQFGPDLSGNRQKLRDGDGVTFTAIGNRKIAHFVERELRRDLQQAASDRIVPLAGAEADQRRISGSKAAATTAGAGRGALTVGSRSTLSAPAQQTPAAAPVADGVGDQKADNSRIAFRLAGAGGRDESVTIDIIRPAIPAAVISLITRKDAVEKPTQPADTMVDDLGNGLTVTSSVSSLGDGPAQRRRQSPTQSPYFAVLVKGERLTPKPGRADDFRWPRQDTLAAEPVSAPGAAKATPPPASSPPQAKPLQAPAAAPAKGAPARAPERAPQR